jgi:hypothetical protein
MKKWISFRLDGSKDRRIIIRPRTELILPISSFRLHRGDLETFDGTQKMLQNEQEQ